jgi:hypothetical protein
MADIAPSLASLHKPNFILVKLRSVSLQADQESRIGIHPIVP